MATGTFDPNGVWNYGEDDNIALFSDLLNLGTESISDAFTVDRARIATVEANMEATSTFVAASATARDAKWGIPANAAAQIVLQNKGARTVRTDIGYTEQYHGVYHATTNPGGRKDAGWYAVPRTTGLVPISPGSVTVTTGTAATNSIGTVSFTGAAAIQPNGVFNSNFDNYLITGTGVTTTAGQALLNLRFTSSAMPNATAGYRYAANDLFLNTANAVSSSPQGAWGATQFNCGSISESSFAFTIDIFKPNLAAPTLVQVVSVGTSVTGGFSHAWTAQGSYASINVFDGFALIPASLLITGSMSVYGYNN